MLKKNIHEKKFKSKLTIIVEFGTLLIFLESP
jgi:hypothetical protein